MPLVIETQEEFIARHGDYIRDKNVIVFKVGALLQDSGERIEPPDSEFERLKIQCRYHRALLEQTQKALTEAAESIATQAEYFRMGAGPPPTDADYATLRKLRDLIAVRQKELEAVEAKLTGQPEVKAQQERMNEQERRNQKAKAYQEKVKDILRGK